MQKKNWVADKIVDKVKSCRRGGSNGWKKVSGGKCPLLPCVGMNKL